MEDEILENEAPMYLWAGRALIEAQNLEANVQNLIVVQRLIQGDLEGTSCVEDLFAQYDRNTLGQLLSAVREYVEIDTSFDEQLSEALELRNWLVHRSFSDLIHKHGGKDALEQAPIEFRKITEQMSNVSIELMEICIAFSSAIGLTPEIISVRLRG